MTQFEINCSNIYAYADITRTNKMERIYLLKHLKDNREFKIMDRSVLIGRSEFSNIQIDSPSLSREHARIVIKEDSPEIIDLHSTNGTFVNSIRLEEPCIIKPGDLITFGEEVFSLQLADQNATLVFNKRVFGNESGSDFLMIEDEEDENSTVMMEKFELPASWSSTPNATDHVTKDIDLVNALVQQRFRKSQENAVMALVIYEKNKAPIVKSIATSQKTESWSIGRSDKSAIKIEDPCISESHAKLEFNAGLWKIIDQNSKNGMTIKNQKMTSHSINSKDDIQLGTVTLQFIIK